MEKIKEWLELTGKSPAMLAAEIGAHPNSISNWLEGRNIPTAMMIRRLHDRTGISLEDLVPKTDAA